MSFSPATDPGAFAAEVLGQPLWDYQLDFARSAARYRVVCAGRQVGKSTTLATLALFEAATRRNVLVLVVSAGEEAAKRLLADCAALASNSSALASSVLDEGKSLLTFSNGSVIRSVPASGRQIRGNPVDLLIVDEAAFIGNDIWQSAEPSIIARPGSRVVLTSSPWGGPEAFFRALWNRGMDAPDLEVQSWHWPSSASPLVDEKLLAGIKARNSEEYFRREFLAEWTDDAGSYFKESELMDAVADYQMCPPEDLEWFLDGRYAAAGGVDWGLNDANVLTLVSVLEDYGHNRHLLGDGLAFFIPWYEAKHKWPYTQFIERIVQTAGFYHLPVIASETNGVGQYPTTMLQDRMSESRHYSPVVPVVTDVRRKQSGFGMIKGLLQSHRLVLPRDPELLKQLRGLEFEQLPSGGLRIAVPERSGHDDVAMSFMQAVSSLRVDWARREAEGFGDVRVIPDDLEMVSTRSGVMVPVKARPVAFHRDAFAYPRGSETGEGW
jgi:hypothetical protein